MPGIFPTLISSLQFLSFSGFISTNSLKNIKKAHFSLSTWSPKRLVVISSLISSLFILSKSGLQSHLHGDETSSGTRNKNTYVRLDKKDERKSDLVCPACHVSITLLWSIRSHSILTLLNVSIFVRVPYDKHSHHNIIESQLYVDDWRTMILAQFYQVMMNRSLVDKGKVTQDGNTFWSRW